MIKIDTDMHYPYKKLFDVMIDTGKLCFETVGRDEEGRLILHRSRTVNVSSAYGEEDEYYVLSQEEFEACARKACKNRHIGKKDLAKYIPGAKDRQGK